jgi:hypothetical protein
MFDFVRKSTADKGLAAIAFAITLMNTSAFFKPLEK